MDVSFDVVEGAAVSVSKTQMEIVRPCVVSGIPIDCSVAMTDPAVLLKAMTVLPAQYTQHPYRSDAYLEDYRIHSVRAVDTVVALLVYRTQSISIGGGPVNVWTKSVDTQAYQIETYQTAKGGKNLLVAYKSGAGTLLGNVPPPDWTKRIGKARIWRTNKLLKFTGRMLLTDWEQNWQDQILALEECINSKPWGIYPRGQFLYLGSRIEIPVSYANQTIIAIATIELNFIYDKKGHFPLLAYFNERREHPNDASTETTLRNKGLPALDDLTIVNGKTLASAYDEGDFHGKFPFDP